MGEIKCKSTYQSIAAFNSLHISPSSFSRACAQVSTLGVGRAEATLPERGFPWPPGEGRFNCAAAPTRPHRSLNTLVHLFASLFVPQIALWGSEGRQFALFMTVSSARTRHRAQTWEGHGKSITIWPMDTWRSPTLVRRLQTWEATLCWSKHIARGSSNGGSGDERSKSCLDSLPGGPCHPLSMPGGRCPDSLARTEALRRGPRLNMSQFSFCFILINSTS